MSSFPPTPDAGLSGTATNAPAWHWDGPATLPGVRAAAIAARAWLAENGVAEDGLGAWELLLSEAGNNVAEHGSEGSALEIDFIILRDRVVARITDHTPGFDWPDSVSLPDDDSESGRGLFLIEALTSARDYLRGKSGNVLTLEREDVAVPPPPPTAAGSDLETELEAMTEELSACYESLSSIFRFTAEARQYTSLKEFAVRLLQHLTTVTGADCGMLRVISGPELTTFAAHGCGEPASCPAGESPLPYEAAAIATRQDQWIESEDAPLAGLVHPFYHEDELMGVITVGRNHSSQPLNAGEVNIIHMFAAFFTQQVLTRRHEEAAIQASVTRREIELAAEIQRSLLPRRLPVWPGIAISGHCESALSVGGDFYDVVPLGPGGFLFLVADVMGKGMGASMMAAVTRQAFRSLGNVSPSPSEIMKRAAGLLFEDLDWLEMFVTVAIGVVDLTRSEVRIANAGHCPVVVAQPDGSVKGCEPTMAPLGLERLPECLEITVPFGPGARLFAYSDGLVDPRDKRSPFESPEEVEAWISSVLRGGRTTAESLKNAILERIGCVPSGGPSSSQADDQTILVIAHDPIPVSR